MRLSKIDRLKLHTFLNSLANNIASPFVGFDVTASGAADILIGYVQAISNLASAVSQLVGGRIADKSGRRVAITIIFSVITGILWVGTTFLKTPILVAAGFTAITIALGFYTAGWTAVVGEASEEKTRGSFLSSFSQLANVGGLVALVATTIAAIYTSFATFYLVSGLVFILSGLVLRGRKEQAVEKRDISGQENVGLRKFYLVSGFYGLFWGFAWPLFTITLVKIVKMDLFQYSLSQMIGVGATVAFQPVIGRLVDKNRRRGVFWGRMGLVAYPIIYTFFSAAWQVYIVNVFSGITNALLNVAFVAYLYDISPSGQRGRYTAELGLVTGVATMAGSLTAAYALSILDTQYSLWLSLGYLYAIAAVGRIVAALLHLRLPYNGQRHEILPGLKKGI
jgi:MFS family permease